MSCHFCYNAHVCAKEPKTEEDYFDPGLDDTNDGSSSTVGDKADGFQVYLNSGGGKPVELEFCQWTKGGYRGHDGWVTVGRYYPKFCPECGRKLDEYIVDERGASFKRKTEE